MNNVNELSPLHAAAIDYATRSMPVFPLMRKGTQPMVKWAVDATTDLDQINKWWTKNPEYNIGILTGLGRDTFLPSLTSTL